MPILAWIVNGLMIVFRSRIGQILAGIFGWLGLTWATQSIVIQPLVDQLYAHVSALTSVGGSYAEMMLHGLGMMKADIAFTMCISAVTIKVGVKAATARFIRKPI